MTTWTDLRRSIEDTGKIDQRLVVSLATIRAMQEHRECAAMGWQRPISQLLAEARSLVQSRAQDILEAEQARRARAKLSATEQFARTAELEAWKCEHAIPPQPEQAREWRQLAANLRRVNFYAIAAE